jgi:hypothetical protein
MLFVWGDIYTVLANAQCHYGKCEPKPAAFPYFGLKWHKLEMAKGA